MTSSNIRRLIDCFKNVRSVGNALITLRSSFRRILRVAPNSKAPSSAAHKWLLCGGAEGRGGGVVMGRLGGGVQRRGGGGG